MQAREYTILIYPEEGAYSVIVPALPGCVTQGATIEEAIAMAREAIGLHIEGLMAEGLPVPEEQEHPQALVVRVAA
ncbi:MAG: type II toxin-antitoxin system HicB family antitoxin [Chloroflexi bacterium]|nr:type II toxin-antitoxin system HicB family antitoxin [Chloroflexota bacterium]